MHPRRGGRRRAKCARLEAFHPEELVEQRWKVEAQLGASCQLEPRRLGFPLPGSGSPQVPPSGDSGSGSSGGPMLVNAAALPHQDRSWSTSNLSARSGISQVEPVVSTTPPTDAPQHDAPVPPTHRNMKRRCHRVLIEWKRGHSSLQFLRKRCHAATAAVVTRRRLASSRSGRTRAEVRHRVDQSAADRIRGSSQVTGTHISVPSDCRKSACGRWRPAT